MKTSRVVSLDDLLWSRTIHNILARAPQPGARNLICATRADPRLANWMPLICLWADVLEEEREVAVILHVL